MNQMPVTNSNVWPNNPIPNASIISLNSQPQQSTTQMPMKPPASLRSRPISAGTSQPRITQPKEANTKVNSWVKGYTNASTNIPSPVVDSETYRQEDSDLSNRVSQLERELKNKTIENKELKDKVAFYQSQHSFGTAASSNVSNTEFEQVKRDKSIAVGLVNTMQKDLANKDGTISKLAREIEGYKREIREKDAAYKELDEKFTSLNNSKKFDEDRANKDKELTVLKTVILRISLNLISANFWTNFIYKCRNSKIQRIK
jgi:predicted RNase H-like nuclease (RuvC/YqgF family)